MAWSHNLKHTYNGRQYVAKIDEDVESLQMKAERFSKIGSETDLKPTIIQDAVRLSLSYMEKRISDRVSLKEDFPEQPVNVMLNEPLFGWVIENLIKNGVDAMKGEGEILF